MKHILAVATAALCATGCDVDGVGTVGPRGGTVVSSDGRFSLDVPAGALDHDVDVTIDVVECDRPDAVGPCYDVSPRGLGFLFPATVTFEIGGMNLGPVDPTSLGLIVQNEHEWTVLADQEVDMDDEIVTASAMYLSAYAIVPVD